MAKRYTDTAKWKKPFIKGLSAKMKLLWFYILDDCDHAGIWEVDLEVASLRIGEEISYDEAFEALGCQIRSIGKNRWYIEDFCFFQYGELKETNRMHQSVIGILNKHNININKGLTSPLQGVKDKDKDKEQDKVKDKDKEQPEISANGFEYQLKKVEQSVDAIDEKLKEYDTWTTQIIEGNDQYFEQMFTHESIPAGEHIQFWIMDHRDLLNRYPKMRPPNQDAFRRSCLKHIRENYKKPTNGKVINKKQQQSDSTSEYLKNYYAEKIGGSKEN